MTGTSELNSDYVPEPPLSVFTIEIAAPGGSSADWRPFPSQEGPLAEYARQIIERFEFKAEVIELAADHDRDTSRPGVILIDQRVLTIRNGRHALEAAVAGLPAWILPMLVLGQPDDPQAEDLANQVRDILDAAGILRSRSARLGARGVSSLRTFRLLLRDLIFDVEGQYIAYRSRQRYGAQQYGSPITSRPSSSQSDSFLSSRLDRSASAADRMGETPDAR